MPIIRNMVVVYSIGLRVMNNKIKGLGSSWSTMMGSGGVDCLMEKVKCRNQMVICIRGLLKMG